MNIFYLSNDPSQCAAYHCDKHVVKMILESVQILSTNHQIEHRNENLYKPTHKNHPSTIWARSSKENYQWLLELTQELGAEYTYRYGKTHKSMEKLPILKTTPEFIPDIPFFQVSQAMPEQYQHPCSIQAYRDYYVGEKLDICQYTKRNRPEWLP